VSNLEKALGIAGRKHSDVSDEQMADILAIVKQAWDEVEESNKYVAELEAENEYQLLFNRGAWTCAVCGEFVPGNDKNHVHDSAKIIAELRFNNSVLSDALVLADRNFLQVSTELERINNFDVEDFISSLGWSHSEDVYGYRYSIEDLEAIVAGNIRNFYSKLIKGKEDEISN
jgi:hypothetical protein